MTAPQDLAGPKHFAPSPWARKIDPYWQVYFVSIFTALLVFAALKFVSYKSSLSIQYPLATTIVISAAGIGFAWMPAAEMSKAMRVVYRTTAIMFALSLWFGDVPQPPNAPSGLARWFTYAPIVAAVAALLSFWRPGMALITYGLTYFYYRALSEAWKFNPPPTEWMPIVESSIVLVLGGIAIAYWRRSAGRELQKAEDARLPLMDAFLIFVVGLHFSNYFWSGATKILLDGGPLSWALENRSDVLIDMAAYMGVLTIADGFPFSAVIRSAIGEWIIAINAATLVSQIACVAVFWRRRAMVWITIVYDIQHIIIFLLMGLFFWKWIILNAALVIALQNIDRKKIPFTVSVTALTACLFANVFFFVAKLGWYDTRSLNYSYFTAVTKDGQELNVPFTYFGAASNIVAHMRIPSGLIDADRTMQGGFPTGGWGQRGRYEVVAPGMQCKLPVLIGRNGPDNERADVQAALSKFVRDWHSAIKSRLDGDGRINFNLYPHHIFVDPRRFREFSELDKRSIIAFRWRRDSVCVDPESKVGGTRLHSRIEFEVPVQ